MKTRKEMKKFAKQNIKKHIVLFILVLAISSFIGAEFKGSLYSTVANDNDVLVSMVDSIKQNGIEKTVENIQQNVEETKKSGNDFFGRSNGVLASSFNAISTGSVYLVGFSVFKNLTNSSATSLTISIIIAMIVYFIFWYYIVNVFQVLTRRMFLEGRTYKKVPFSRLMFLKRTKKWNKVSRAMLRKDIFLSLWYLTIIGGMIKEYSYLMVPYILAENPDIKGKDAIKLSREMMKGHKFEALKIELSIIGWDILGIITFGIANILFVNLYKQAIFSEFYVELRKLAKENNIENSDLLNDKYLYETAGEKLLNEEYSDAVEVINKEDFVFEKKKGFKYFIFELLGIHSYTEEEKKYEQQQLKDFISTEYEPVLKKEKYPFRLFTIQTMDKKKHIESLNYMRHYSLNSLVLMFFIISFVGWVWEVVLYLVNEGIFVNRGTLHGPWLPIYGGGSLLILLFLNKYRKNPMLQFVLAMILCGILEYFTAWILEATHGGTKWWDYSGYFINLHGRICAEGLIVFGLGGLAMVYFVAPAIDNKLREIKNKTLLIAISVILIVLYGIDTVYSSKNPNTGRGITDYQTSKVECFIDNRLI